MQRCELTARFFLACLALAACGVSDAQQLWKYTDKDGKVTYSDKAPKKGETATPVTSDSSTNMIEAPKNLRQGVPQKLQDVKDRANEKEAQRAKLRAAVDAAKEQLAAAKSMLDEGREPQEGEVQIVVGRSKVGGAPTGKNSQLRKPEYYTRVAALEEAVKKAEEKLVVAERIYREEAP
ncbi:MAG: DUF4124 domain-containing protein [Betaproteobacteria bacterium]